MFHVSFVTLKLCLNGAITDRSIVMRPAFVVADGNCSMATMSINVTESKRTATLSMIIEVNWQILCRRVLSK